MPDGTNRSDEQLDREKRAFLDGVRFWYHEQGVAEDKKALDAGETLRTKFRDPEMAREWELLIGRLRVTGLMGSGSHSAITAEMLKILYRKKGKYCD